MGAGLSAVGTDDLVGPCRSEPAATPADLGPSMQPCVTVQARQGIPLGSLFSFTRRSDLQLSPDENLEQWFVLFIPPKVLLNR